jgi:hypothetical protein
MSYYVHIENKQHIYIDRVCVCAGMSDKESRGVRTDVVAKAIEFLAQALDEIQQWECSEIDDTPASRHTFYSSPVAISHDTNPSPDSLHGKLCMLLDTLQY